MQAQLEFRFDDAQAAAAIAKALAIEAANGPDGTNTTVDAVPGGLRIEVTAQGLSDLRAALHSVVRLLDTAHRSLQ
jgi:tRNA threonylcarbamoyladenosine modification (KEOPS) complex  Pcc1 subunit